MDIEKEKLKKALETIYEYKEELPEDLEEAISLITEQAFGVKKSAELKWPSIVRISKAEEPEEVSSDSTPFPSLSEYFVSED